MANMINNLMEGAFGLTVVVLFIAFIWSRISKKTMGEIYDEAMAWFDGSKSKLNPQEKIKQVWQEKRTRM